MFLHLASWSANYANLFIQQQADGWRFRVFLAGWHGHGRAHLAAVLPAARNTESEPSDCALHAPLSTRSNAQCSRHVEVGSLDSGLGTSGRCKPPSQHPRSHVGGTSSRGRCGVPLRGVGPPFAAVCAARARAPLVAFCTFFLRCPGERGFKAAPTNQQSYRTKTGSALVMFPPKPPGPVSEMAPTGGMGMRGHLWRPCSLQPETRNPNQAIASTPLSAPVAMQPPCGSRESGFGSWRQWAMKTAITAPELPRESARGTSSRPVWCAFAGCGAAPFAAVCAARARAPLVAFCTFFLRCPGEWGFKTAPGVLRDFLFFLSPRSGCFCRVVLLLGGGVRDAPRANMSHISRGRVWCGTQYRHALPVGRPSGKRARRREAARLDAAARGG
jgi:hypothetical protein